MQLIPPSNPLRTFARWPVTLGLIGVLVLTGTARWRLLTQQHPQQDSARPVAPLQQPVASLRATVSVDGSVTLENEGKKIKLDELTRQPASSDKARKVELSVDPRAPAAAVQALLDRLRDSGASQCTLVIDLAAETANNPIPVKTDDP